MCAPPDFADLLARVGVPLVPVGQSVRALVHGATPPSTADAPRVAADLVAAQFDTVAAAAEGCDALVATGLMPAGARTIAEKLGIRYVFAWLHSSRAPVATPPAAGAAGPAVSTGRDRQPGAVGRGCRAGASAVRPAAQRPPGGDGPSTGGQRPRPRLHRPALAGGGPDPGPLAWFAGPRRRADRRVDPAGRAPTPGRVGGVPGRRHSAGVRGLQQRARPGGRRPGGHRGDPSAGPSRTRLAAAGRTWPWSTTGTTASTSARSTCRHCSAGWPPSCTTAERARRRRPLGPARLRWWCPR